MSQGINGNAVGELPFRIRAVDVSRMLAVCVRKVQQMAKQGHLPGAARVGNLWTFDPAQIRSWVKAQEAACRRTYTAEAARTTADTPSGASYSESAYERAISVRPGSGSKASGKERSARRRDRRR
jgi:hypothetical protein